LHFSGSHAITTPAAPVVRCASHILTSQITQRLALIPRTIRYLAFYHLTDSHVALYPRPNDEQMISNAIKAHVLHILYG